MRRLVVGQERTLVGDQAVGQARTHDFNQACSLVLQAQGLDVQACPGGLQVNVLVVLSDSAHLVTFLSQLSAPDGGRLPREDPSSHLALYLGLVGWLWRLAVTSKIFVKVL